MCVDIPECNLLFLLDLVLEIINVRILTGDPNRKGATIVTIAKDETVELELARRGGRS